MKTITKEQLLTILDNARIAGNIALNENPKLNGFYLLLDNFNLVDLRGYDFSPIHDLRNINFRYVDLTGSSFENCILDCASFENSKLSNCNFSGSRLWSTYIFFNHEEAQFKNWKEEHGGGSRDIIKYISTRLEQDGCNVQNATTLEWAIDDINYGFPYSFIRPDEKY